MALFVAIAVGMESQKWEDNYFEILNLPRTASPKDVRNAWKAASAAMHPDVNTDPNAEELFMKLAKIKDTLTGISSRKVYVNSSGLLHLVVSAPYSLAFRYDRWGPKFYEAQHHDVWLANPMTMAYVHAQEYFGLIFFTFIVTIEKSRARARWWCFAFLGALLFYEINLKYEDDDWDYLMFLLPQWTIYEKMVLLHTAAYFTINLAVQWAHRTYVDYAEFHFQNLVNNQVEMARMLEDIRAQLADVTNKKKSSDGEAAGVADGKELKRQAKINKFKNAKYGAEMQQQQAQQGGGVNWINLIILLLTLYSQWS